MSAVCQFVRWMLAIAVICVCVLLAPAVSAVGVGAVEQPAALISAQAKKTANQGYADYLADKDVANSPVEAKQILKTVGLVRDIVHSESLVAGTQISSGNTVNVIQPDSEDSGDSEDSTNSEDSSTQEEPSQPEPPSQPEYGSDTSDEVYVIVPNLVGSTVQEATAQLEPDLKLGEVSGAAYEGSDKCAVIDSQNPGAGDEVPQGSAVDVYLKPVYVTIPDLVGKSVPQAKELLKPDLTLGEVSGKGDVIGSQNPSAGTKAPCGSIVNVSLKPVYVVVPDLVGKSVPQAKELLKPDLTLGEVSGKCGVIKSQQPGARQEALRGSAVNVYLEAGLVPVPHLVNQTVDEARAVLAAAGLVLGNDPAGDRRVENQQPAAKTLVCPGSAVTVTVSAPSAPSGPPRPPEPPAPPRPPAPPVVLPEPLVVPPPVVQPPVGPLPAGPAPEAPPGASPEVPLAEAPVTPVARLIPWMWPVAATLALLVAGLLASRAIRAQQGRKGMPADIRVVAGADLGTDAEVMQSPSDHSPPTYVVRIEPHADSGTQVLKEVHQ